MNPAKYPPNPPPLTSHFSPSCVECYKCGRGWGPHAAPFSSNPICPEDCKSRLPPSMHKVGLAGGVPFLHAIGQNRWLLRRAGPPALHPHYHHFLLSSKMRCCQESSTLLHRDSNHCLLRGWRTHIKENEWVGTEEVRLGRHNFSFHV